MNSSQNQFRRFIYISEIHSTPAKKMYYELIDSSLDRMGILQITVYYREENYVFIVDAEPTMSHNDVGKTLASYYQKLPIKRHSVISNDELFFLTPPLERIYELNQKVDYNPKEGQLKSRMGPCKRHVLTLLLKEDSNLIAEYKRVHSIGKAWPQITTNMRQVGVKDMEIYLIGFRAILLMDTPLEFDMNKVGPIWQALPRELEWQEYVSKFQRTRPNSSIQEKWLAMKTL